MRQIYLAIDEGNCGQVSLPDEIPTPPFILPIECADTHLLDYCIYKTSL